jgi:hypothetical protein
MDLKRLRTFVTVTDLARCAAVRCNLPCGRCRARCSGREPCAAHIARARRSRAGGRDHSVRAAHRSLQADHRPRRAQEKTAARPLCHPVGQAASDAELCGELLRGARRLYARGPADYPTVPTSNSSASERSGKAPARWSHRLSAPGRDVVMLQSVQVWARLRTGTTRCCP